MASLHSRTRSLSTGQAPPLSPGAMASTGIKKKFACSHSGCGKSFSRSEHLHRHALNHKDGNNTCLRCSAHFRRRDLLERHMLRHKEKDDEAGGEGLGILATRKRLWRDGSGKIINARRPSCINAPRMSLSIDTIAMPVSTKRRASSARERKSKLALPSPPMSSMSSQTRSMSPRMISAPATASVSQSSYMPTSPSAHARPPHKLEGATPLDPWLTSSNGLPLPLPSPPMSEASLGSNAQTHSPNHVSHEPSLYDEPHHTPWPVMHHHPDASPEHQGHPRSQPAFLQPTAHQWAPPPPQPFQTFMGSIGAHEHSHTYAAEEEELGIFKPELEVGTALSSGVGIGLGMYEWNNGQHNWANGGAGMVSKVREERYDSPTAPEKREPGPSLWNGYAQQVPSPVYGSRAYSRC